MAYDHPDYGTSDVGRAYWQSDKGVDVPEIQLPHQCGEWRIGGVEAARRLVADLERLIEEAPPS